MKKTSKLLAVFLAVIMIVSMLPTMAFAEEVPSEVVETAVAEEAEQTIEAPVETPAVEAPAAPVEETKEEAPAEATAEETPAEVKAEETPAEPKAEEAPAEVKTEEVKTEQAPVALETAEKKEQLVSALDGDEVVGTVDVDSHSDYASFTRTFTEEDLTQKAAGNLVKVTYGDSVEYYPTITTTVVTDLAAHNNNDRTLTLLGNIALAEGDGNVGTGTNGFTLSGSQSSWGNGNYGAFTFDLNGYTITYNGSQALFNCSRYGFTLKNGNIVYNGTGTRSVMQNNTSTGQTATGGTIWSPKLTVENMTIFATGSGSFAVLRSYSWGANWVITNSEIVNGTAGYALDWEASKVTTDNQYPTDLVFRPKATITNTFMSSVTSYAFYAVLSSGTLATSITSDVTFNNVDCVSNYTIANGKTANLSHNTAFETKGGSIKNPDGTIRETESWSGTVFNGTALNGYLFEYRSTWPISFDTDGDGTVDATEIVAYDANPTHAEADRPGYSFDGWLAEDGTTYPAGTQLPTPYTTGAATYTAQFTEITGDSAVVTFVNYDSTELASRQYAIGATPVYPGSTPERDFNEEFMFTWSGWTDGENTYGRSEMLPSVSGNITYTATFVTNPTPFYFYDETDTVVGYFDNLQDAIAMSDQYNADSSKETAPVGKIVMRDDVVDTYSCYPSTYYAFGNSYNRVVANELKKSIHIDFGGHIYTTTQANYAFYMMNGAPSDRNPAGMQIVFENGAICHGDDTDASVKGSSLFYADNYAANVVYSMLNMEFYVLGDGSNTAYAFLLNERFNTSSFTASNCLFYGGSSAIMTTCSGTNNGRLITGEFFGCTFVNTYLLETDNYQQYIGAIASTQSSGAPLGTAENGPTYSFDPACVLYSAAEPTEFIPAFCASVVNSTFEADEGYGFGTADFELNSMYGVSVARDTAGMRKVGAGIVPASFLDANGDQLDLIYVCEGATPVYNGPVPTKAASGGTTYRFIGWSLTEGGDVIELAPIDEPTEYYPVFEEATVVWTYISADGNSTSNFDTLIEAYTDGLLADLDGSGVIRLMADSYTILDDDKTTSSNQTIVSPTKDVTIDLYGHTLYDSTGRNLFYLDQPNAGANFISTAVDGSGAPVKGVYVKTPNGSNCRGVVAFGGTGSSASMIGRTCPFVMQNISVEASTATSSIISSYFTSEEILIENCDIVGPYDTGIFVFQSGKNWSTSTNIDWNMTLKNSTFNSKWVIYVNCSANNATIDPDKFHPTFKFDGTNTFTYSGYTDAYGTIVTTLKGGSAGSAFDYASAVTDGDALSITTPTTEVIDGTTYYTVDITTGSANNVTWHFPDGTTVQNTAASGAAPIVPTYEISETWGEVLGWSLTDGGEVVDINAVSLTADTDFYLIVTDATVQAENSVVKLELGGNTYYYTTITRAMSLANGQTATITLLKDITMDGATEEKGDTVSTAAWFGLLDHTDLTLDLAGHTLDGGTSTALKATGSYGGCDLNIFQFMPSTSSAAYDIVVTVLDGVMATHGARGIALLGTTSAEYDCTQNKFIADGVTFIDSYTSRDTASYTIGVAAKAATPGSVLVHLEDCVFTCESEEPVRATVIALNRTTLGACAAEVEFENCAFSNVASAFYGDTNANSLTKPQVTIDAATAASIVENMNGCVTEREYLYEGSSYDPAVATYVFNPIDASVTDAYACAFNLATISMSLQDYIYLNVGVENSTGTSQYYVVSSGAPADAILAETATAQISNYGISAKDMDAHFNVTAYTDLGTTRYLSGTRSSIDDLCTRTAEAADAATESGSALIAAMNAMKAYGDWAKYSFDTTGTAPEPAAVTYVIGDYDAAIVNGKANTVSSTPGYYGTSAVLRDQIYLKHYFYRVEALTDVNTTATDSQGDPFNAIELDADGSGLFGTVKLKIAPKNFEERYTVQITIGTKTYSVETCLAQYASVLAERGSSEKEQTLAKALLAYCDAAKTYFATASAG